MRLCKACDEEVQTKTWSSADDWESLDWCESCQATEPETYEGDICADCGETFPEEEMRCDGENDPICEACYQKWFVRSALEAGIPLSVIEGKTKLSDHWSQAYIDYKCGKTREDK